MAKLKPKPKLPDIITTLLNSILTASKLVSLAYESNALCSVLSSRQRVSVTNARGGLHVHGGAKMITMATTKNRTPNTFAHCILVTELPRNHKSSPWMKQCLTCIEKGKSKISFSNR